MPADLLAAGHEPENMLKWPLFVYFHRPRAVITGSVNTINIGALFRAAEDAEGRFAIAIEALATKLARALSMEVNDVDTDQPVYSCGVDSLVAVEVRDWLSKEFAATIPVFELTSVPGAYIIEFEDGLDIESFRLQNGPEFEMRVMLNYKLFNGLSIQLRNVETAQEMVGQLSNLSTVKNVWPVRLISRPDPEVIWTGTLDEMKQHGSKSQDINNTEPYSPHAMSQIDRLHAEGITGKGIKIAVIDSGVDYSHPDLGGCFGEGCLVTNGYDFVGDLYDGWDPIPDDDPMDCDGHGTHVAGIISAAQNRYGSKGAAPGATLAAYRVFGCFEGFVTDDILIAAFNQAYEDGADIITASIGGTSGWSKNPLAVAVSRIVEAGVPCTLAAGNSGDLGLFDAHTAATGEGVTAVASFDNTMTLQSWHRSYYTIDGGENVAFPYEYSYPQNWNGTLRALWATSYNLSDTMDACEPLPENTPNLSEYIVLVRRGACEVTQQAQNVANHGTRFLIIYENNVGIDWFSVSSVAGIVATAAVSRETGETWVKALEAGSNVATSLPSGKDAEKTLFILSNTYKPGAVSEFSSWGPTFEMNPKPQFGAAGTSILSTYATRWDPYAILSGTSMATPLVAAAFALVAEARGTLEPAEIENRLAATSNPQLWFNITGDGVFEDWLTPSAQQGAGLIQVYDAAYSTTLLRPSSLSFNDTEHNTAQSFRIENEGKEAITYKISHVPSNTIYVLNRELQPPDMFPNDDLIIRGGAKLSFSEREVTIAPGDKAIIKVTAAPPQEVQVLRYPLWSGYITVNGTDGSSLSLPYQGIAGSLRDAEILLDDNLWVATSADRFFDPIPPKSTFHFPPPGEGINYRRSNSTILMTKLDWGSPRTIVEAIPVTLYPTNGTARESVFQSLGRLLHLPPPWTPSGLSMWDWRGGLETGEYVPPGMYKLRVKFLRIFGNESDEEDWVVKETTSFYIEYIS
ncbi:Minor extracellular protease vpr [Paramyrothecium foliicola]|nr:Minor extracellular protease vpr [Paramyrothecium foliicola]